MLRIWELHKVASPDLKLTIIVVLAVAEIRERLIFERSLKSAKLREELALLVMERDLLEKLLMYYE